MNGITISGNNNQMSTGAAELFRRNLRASMSDNTFRAYGSQLKTFAAFCAARGVSAFPCEPYTIACYIEHLKETGHKMSTINQTIAAITKQHRAAGVVSPCDDVQVKAAIAAASREIGTAPKQKAAITSDVLSVILSAMSGQTLKDMRDRALIALGFMGAFRRSEIAALRASDLEYTTDKSGRRVVLVTVRRSKTDQTGAGMVKAIFAGSKTVDAVALLADWIAAAGISGDMPLFSSINRHGQRGNEPLNGYSIARIIKERAAAAGVALDVSGHSLRRGFVTSAVESGATERAIMHQTGHKSAQMVRRYIERHDVTTDNAAALL